MNNKAKLNQMFAGFDDEDDEGGRDDDVQITDEKHSK
jgi:hypothetical protein